MDKLLVEDLTSVREKMETEDQVGLTRQMLDKRWRFPGSLREDSSFIIVNVYWSYCLPLIIHIYNKVRVRKLSICFQVESAQYGSITIRYIDESDTVDTVTGVGTVKEKKDQTPTKLAAIQKTPEKESFPGFWTLILGTLF